AEDVAGIIIVLSILVSAGIVLWESSRRLVDPQSVQHLPWVAAAAIVGFVGNEAVAMLQIGVGRRIGSEALISDGLHARTDGLTSLAVLVAAGGAWLGMPLADPVIGLIIGVVILAIGWDATKRIWGRLMDSVDPQLTESARRVLADRPDVRAVDQVRLRYVGHRLHGDVRIQVTDPSQATAVVADIRRSLGSEVPELVDLVIEAR
ncbi:MAG: cation diffusion facilitator family transporter, partial [Actinomycetota bacterium]